MKKLIKTLTLLAVLSFSGNLFALSYTDIASTLADIFQWSVDSNEGDTTFRSLLIPFGGRTESLGNAFTGLCDDISFLRYNPAGSCIQTNTQFALFHNSWIADSNMETLAYTIRINHLGLSAFASTFYVPFTEYNYFGERVAGNYYSETVGGLNISYNFLAGYTFKGFALGTTAKVGWRSVPDYADDDTGSIISWSGFKQSSMAIMVDAGLMLQFNLFKFYASREPNLKIGIAAQNLGVGITGAFSNSGLSIEAVPTYFAVGLSYKVIKPITITADYKQPVNFINPDGFHWPYLGAGVNIQFAHFLSFLAGLELKGANPKISAGMEFEIAKVRLNMCYSLDLTSSLNPLNKFSLSMKLVLGDLGRAEKSAEVDRLYSLGLQAYTEQNWEKAIEIWEECLKIDKRFDPATTGIVSAQYQIDMFRKIQESLQLD